MTGSHMRPERFRNKRANSKHNTQNTGRRLWTKRGKKRGKTFITGHARLRFTERYGQTLTEDIAIELYHMVAVVKEYKVVEKQSNEISILACEVQSVGLTFFVYSTKRNIIITFLI